MLAIIEEARREEYLYCKENPTYFIQEYVKIESKEGSSPIIPFILWPLQKQALKSIMSHRLNIILKARQLGITWLVLAIALHMLLSEEGASVVALSRTETEAKELVRRMNIMLSNLGAFVHQPGEEGWNWFTYKSKSTEINLFLNGKEFSCFKVFASAAGAARSFTANLIIFDEWAYQQFAEEIWISGLPTVNRVGGGKVIGVSTMQLGTLFEKLWRYNRQFNKIFLPWNADPSRNEKWYEDTKDLMGELVKQEYPMSADEALCSPGGSFFQELRRHIHVCEPFEIPSSWRKYHAIDYGLDMLAGIWAAFDNEGNAFVYREIYESDLIIPDACARMAELENKEEIYARYAPPDLFGRSGETGKTRIEAFQENGFIFEKSSADREAGWSALKEWLRVYTDKNGASTSRLKIFSCCPNLIRTLFAIERDKKRPSDCAKEPHELTHAPDALRYLMINRPCGKDKEQVKDKWISEAESFLQYGQ